LYSPAHRSQELSRI